MRKHRAARVRDEMRQWLRSRYGLRSGYSQCQIDAGREDLGFRGADDALLAYTLFGHDLAPDVAVPGGVTVDVEELLAFGSDSGSGISFLMDGGD